VISRPPLLVQSSYVATDNMTSEQRSPATAVGATRSAKASC
jgi:hypothetical protein